MKKKNIVLFMMLLMLLLMPVANVFAVTKVSCGNVTDIPEKIPELTSFAVTLIQVLVPIILVIMGSLDLFKGITSQKEEEIKKGQKVFIKRLITASIIFFAIVVVKFFISVVSESNSVDIISCIDCFLSKKCN